MHCPEVRERLSLKLDGRLPEADERALQVHLKDCPACMEVWRRWRAIDELFAAAPTLQPPEDLTARILARIRPEPQPSALGATVLVLGFGLALWVAALVLPLLVTLCLAVMAGGQSPWLLAAGASVGASLLRLAAAVAEAGRLLLWGAVHSPSGLVAGAYGLVTIGAVVAWLRVVVFRPHQAWG